jgi:8-oxo-dGTP diphosphatase
LTFGQTPRLLLGLFGSGWASQAYDIVWPLYVFLIIGSYEFLGGIVSLSLLVSLVFLWAAGRLADRFGSRILRLSALLEVFNLLIRPLLNGKMFLFLADLSYQLAALFVWIPLDRLSYQTALQTKRLEFFLSREIALHGGSLLVTLILLASFNLFGLNWAFIFLLTGLGFVLIGQLGLAKEEGLKSAGVVLIREDGAILLQLRDRKSNIVFPDCWCLPGGKVKIGESPAAAARRELQEETGLELSLDKLTFLAQETYELPNNEKITRHLFWGRYNGQKIECFEEQRMEFIKPEDFARIKMYPGHEKFCRQALEKLKLSSA